MMNKIIAGQSRVVVQQYTIDTAVPSAVVIQDGFNPAIIIDIKPPDPNGSSYATDIDFITIFPMSGKIGNQIGIIQRCGDILYIEGVTP